ncbi:hypothetical protein BO94DRAFT_589828 [Aspergillus sclerotioniger CBS 115572]|uniref:Uncharacterized protein n=1 Tax=Aspergillus sclerotioniger CBS 115572 TaxID=1450535 RepID=A0A317VGH1_9EURO|nr:hypothetical protein BO94DRAFT_589828 [Aspergillus sclerotioniger CBS 115572]PWY72251.1 hypothetical protein BO94DRAFT_589828 [Aspergillus sclerotioniger CBS 115572]
MSNSSTETEADTPHNIPPYTPMTSLGHELGVLFGFLSACFVVMAVYVYFWRAAERREDQAQKLRREMLLNRGIHHGRGGIHEKMLNQTLTTQHPPHQQQNTPLPGAEIGVVVTTGMGTAMEIGSPSLGPARMVNIHRKPVNNQGNSNGYGGGEGNGNGVRDGAGVEIDADADADADVGVEMDVLGFLGHGHGHGFGYGQGQNSQGYGGQGQGQGQGYGYGR